MSGTGTDSLTIKDTLLTGQGMDTLANIESISFTDDDKATEIPPAEKP